MFWNQKFHKTIFTLTKWDALCLIPFHFSLVHSVFFFLNAVHEAPNWFYRQVATYSLKSIGMMETANQSTWNFGSNGDRVLWAEQIRAFPGIFRPGTWTQLLFLSFYGDEEWDSRIACSHVSCLLEKIKKREWKCKSTGKLSLENFVLFRWERSHCSLSGLRNCACYSRSSLSSVTYLSLYLCFFSFFLPKPFLLDSYHFEAQTSDK